MMRCAVARASAIIAMLAGVGAIVFAIASSELTAPCVPVRGIPAGGVGRSCGGTVVPGVVAAASTAGAAGCAWPSRCPQCWQKAKPDGVCLPQALQLTLPASAGCAARAASEVPHDLQKFIPLGFAVPQELQTTFAAAAVALAVAPAVALAGAAALGGAAASIFWPQSWQNSAPSRFTFPQWLHRGIARVSL
jgi:hypothetical protein